MSALPAIPGVGVVVRPAHRWLRIAEVWFDAARRPGDADLLVARQWPAALPVGRWSDKHTLIVDLAADEGSRLARCSKDTQYQIRRAGAKDGLRAVFVGGAEREAFDAFCDFYDRFAALKSLAGCDRAYLRALVDAGALALGCASRADEALVWHSYVLAGTRARLLHSASLQRATADSSFRTLVGRANRWLHWQDMAALAAAGFTEYDFGGWYAGHTDRAKLGINAFKQEFGGVLRHEFDGVAPLSWRGRLYLQARRLAVPRR